MQISAKIPLSFEFFPPKTLEGKKNLCETAKVLCDYRPDYFSVTFGAGGSTRDGTIETVMTLQQQANTLVVPHISCIGVTRADIIKLLERYKSLGIKKLVALRGDLPSGMVQVGDCHYASELVALIRDVSNDYFHISVAAYPEIHPQALSAHDDVLNLKRKYQAGANCAITQYFFNPDAYFYYIDECAKLGINMPIIPGIMPITQFAKLARFSDVCGAEIPRWIRKRLESYGDDTKSIKAFGLEVLHQLCQRLIAGGAPALHFYTLNKTEGVTGLMNLIGVYSEKSRRQAVS